MSDNFRLLKNLFSELEQPLFLGDGLATGEFHSLMQPGQFISTNLKESDASDDMQIQADLTNDLIDTKFIYTSLTGTISQQYTDALQNAALPYTPISAADQQQIDSDNAWLEANVNTYNVFQGRYFDALDLYSQEASKQIPDQAKLSRYLSKLNQASHDWETMGRKSAYERKQAEVIYLQSGDPATMWSGFKDLLNFHSKSAPHRGPYLQTFLSPPVAQWNSPGMSWARFEKTIDESSTYSYSSETSWGGGGSADWGLFSIGGSGGGSSTYNHSESDTSTVQVAFDYARIRISRPWLVGDIFNYRFWWWKKAFGYRLFSDGGVLSGASPVRPVGVFPFLPKYLIVARNLTITANFDHKDQTTVQNNINGSASFGWGPFSLSGSYNESNTTQTTHGSFDGTTIRVDQPQIIAFTGALMPLSPNPDRTLPWRDDHAPFDPPKGVVDSLRAVRNRDFLAACREEFLWDAERRIAAEVKRARAKARKEAMERFS